jgi:5-keto 4-deoxyuronate isomerase
MEHKFVCHLHDQSNESYLIYHMDDTKCVRISKTTCLTVRALEVMELNKEVFAD